MMIAKSPTEVYLALNQEGYVNSILIKFADLNISDKIQWYNQLGFDLPAWNYKYITSIVYHQINLN